MDDQQLKELILLYDVGGSILPPPVSSDLAGLGEAPIALLPVDEMALYLKLRATERAKLAAEIFLAQKQPYSLGYREMSPEETEERIKKFEEDSKETLERYALDLINWNNDFKNHPDWAKEENVKADYSKWLLNAASFKSMYESILDSLKDGKYLYPGCIYNALKDPYGVVVYTNKQFQENPELYGFTLGTDNPKLGDVFSNGHHMIMYTGNDEQGLPLYTWARGNEFEGMVNNGHFPVKNENMQHYSYIGTEKDREKWKKEKESEKKDSDKKETEKKELGGTLKENMKEIKLCKNGSILDLLKNLLGDSDIIDLLLNFGIDDLLQGGLKNTKNMSIQIVIAKEDEEDDGGHKIPELKTIEIGNKSYKVEVVTSEEDMEKGLGNRESLDKDKGMLFDFGEVQDEVTFNMEECHFPLDIIFIDDDCEVIRVAHGCPDSLDLYTEKDVRYVLEVNPKSGVKEGDELELDPEKEAPVMKVLAPDGSTQMELQGGERIFSRKNTKTLIRMAKRAEKSKSESDYKKLGNKMFKYILTQDTNTPEYVEVPED